MAKISIDIDGKDLSLKIDGKEIKDLQDVSLYFGQWKERGTGEVFKQVNFDYATRDEGSDDFSSIVRYFYNPSKASFNDGQKMINTKHPSKVDYERM